MKCARCQQENPPQAKFCMKCGAGLMLACKKCGTELPTGAAFCFSCGQQVAGAPAGQRFTSPETYTPKHLAKKILTSKSALEGERKQVTVLFADLKGSMELLADRDPEEARKLLDPVLEHMMEAVHRFEGTVNQVMGDGIMALFGAPVAHEDHAVRACYAALRMQENVGRYAEELRRSQGINVQIRVGLNSGEVVVRAIGSDLHMDYTAVGQTTHLAARMEQLASPGTTLLTGDTLRLAEGYVEVKALGPVPVKGLAEPVEVYEMLRAGPVRSRLQALTARGLTRFVGRDAEIEVLRQALERARTGHGQVVAVVGEPGVGKSRLFFEFIHSHRTHGWLMLESSSVSYGRATIYLPVIDLLKAYFQIEPRDDGRKIREKITGKLLTLDRVLEPMLPAFLSLLDVPVEDPQWQALDPPQRRQRTLEAVKRLLLRESQVQPLCLVFEDLHWIDSETQALLDSLVESLPTAGFLLLVNYRPEYQHRWGGKTYYTQLRIDPLPPESAQELLAVLLGSDAGLQPLKQLLIQHTEGNPFFLEESVRTLVETKALLGDRGAYRLAKALPTIQVPPTVQAVLAARIDRLSPEEKGLLQSTSVIGEHVPFTLLQAIVEMPEDELRGALSHLQAVEFLYETSVFPDLEYSFKHGLTYQVAYGSLLVDRRRILHARIVETIERLYPDRLAEHVERLAHHALRGEVWVKAVPYLQQAWAKAFARSAYHEAAAYCEQALTALQHLPETPDTLAQAVDLRIRLRDSLWPLGDERRIFACLREAETLCQALSDQRRLGRVLVYLDTCFGNAGEYDRGIEYGRRALAIAEELGDFNLQVLATDTLAGDHRNLGDYGQAIALYGAVVGWLTDDRVPDRPGIRSGVALACLAWCLADIGEFTRAIPLADEALQIAESADHPFSLAFACFGVGYVHVAKGDFSRAIPMLERSLEVCRTWQIASIRPWVTSAIATAYALSGRVDEVLPLLEQMSEETTAGVTHAPIGCALGEAYLTAGRDALPSANRALAIACRRRERGWEARALYLIGEIASRQAPPGSESAQDHYGRALSLAAELGMRPLVARCHLGLGRLHRKAGNERQACDHLVAATAIFREMDMRLWLEQGESALKELG